MDATKPVRIFLDMFTDGPLAKAIKLVLPGTGNQPTHVYVETVAEADVIFDLGLVQTAGLEGLVQKINERRGCDPPLSVSLGAVLQVEEISNPETGSEEV